MAPKKYKCNQCNKTHKKPIDEQCPSVLHNDSIEINSHDHQQQSDVSSQILAELQKLNGRIATVEEKVQNNAQKLSNVIPQVYNTPVTQHQLVGEASNGRSRHSSAADLSVHSQDIVVTSLNSLQTSKRIQAEVDERLRHLAHLSTEQGKLKSQREGSENIYIKKQIPWPQNHILGGQSRPCHMTVCHGVNGWQVLPPLQERSQTWTRKMRCWNIWLISWRMPTIFRRHPPRAVMQCYSVKWRKGKYNGQTLIKSTELDGHMPSDSLSKMLKILRKNLTAERYMPAQSWHESGSNFYKHICSVCASQGKEYRHAAKDCCVSRPKNEAGIAKLQCQT